VLRLFKEATTTPLSGYMLQTPQHKGFSTTTKNPAQSPVVKEDAGPKKGPRLREKNSAGKAILHLAQETVAKKCGIIK
jgi:hypothetical protein